METSLPHGVGDEETDNSLHVACSYNNYDDRVLVSFQIEDDMLYRIVRYLEAWLHNILNHLEHEIIVLENVWFAKELIMSMTMGELQLTGPRKSNWKVVDFSRPRRKGFLLYHHVHYLSLKSTATALALLHKLMFNIKLYNGSTNSHLPISIKEFQMQESDSGLARDRSNSSWEHMNNFSNTNSRDNEIHEKVPLQGPRPLATSDRDRGYKIDNITKYDRPKLPDDENMVDFQQNILMIGSSNNYLLLVSGLIATITFQVAISLASSNFYQQNRKDDATTINYIILLNSFGYMASLFTIMILLQEFPYRPWSQLAVFAQIGSYACLIMKISPQLAWPVLFLSIPLLLLGAAVEKSFFRDVRRMAHNIVTNMQRKESS